MLLLALSILSTNLFIQAMPTLFSVPLIMVLAAIFLIIMYRLRHAQTAQLKWLSAILLIFVCTVLQLKYELKHQLPQDWINKTLQVQGRVLSFPQQKEKTKFLFEITQVLKDSQWKPFHLKTQLHWSTKKPRVTLGETWRLQIRLKLPRSYANPGVFDQEKWFWSNGIRAVGHVQSSRNNQLISKLQGLHPIDRLRSSVKVVLEHHLQDNHWKGIFEGLIIGDRTQITEEQRKVFQLTGTSHLLAISGLHMSLVVVIAGYLIGSSRFAFQSSGFLSLSNYTATVKLIMALIYSCLAGLSLSTQRAMLMASVVLISEQFSRRVSSLYSYCFSLIIVLLIDPKATLSPSFWFSYMAVALLFTTIEVASTFKEKILTLFKVQFILLVGLAPFNLLWSHQLSPISVIANLIAVPWMSLFLVPIALLGTAIQGVSESVGHGCFLLASSMMDWLWPLLRRLSEIDSLQWHQYLSLDYHWIFVIIAFAFLFIFKGALRYLSILWLLPIFSVSATPPPTGAFRVTMLDVGQGLSVFVQTHRHQLLYDAGPAFRGSDTGMMVILPYLKSQRIGHLDLMMISHGDLDHRGGAVTVLKGIEVHSIMTSAPEYFHGHHPISCQAGQHWDWDGVSFEILAPRGQWKEPNNNSCVLQITNGRYTALFTGDIENSAEKALLKNKHLLTQDLMTVPHHGSKTSSSEIFLNKIKPKNALFSFGYLNRYHHPSPEVLERYRNIHTFAYNTQDSGAITFEIDRSVKLVGEHRKQHRHYWDNSYATARTTTTAKVMTINDRYHNLEK